MGELKKFKGKFIHKHEFEKDWLNSNYIPEVGEIVLYDPEVDIDGNTLDDAYIKEEGRDPYLPGGRIAPIHHTRQKLGDGIHTVNELKFSSGALDYGDGEGSI
jgi:hypothetical protein